MQAQGTSTKSSQKLPNCKGLPVHTIGADYRTFSPKLNIFHPKANNLISANCNCKQSSNPLDFFYFQNFKSVDWKVSNTVALKSDNIIHTFCHCTLLFQNALNCSTNVFYIKHPNVTVHYFTIHCYLYCMIL